MTEPRCLQPIAYFPKTETSLFFTEASLTSQYWWIPVQLRKGVSVGSFSMIKEIPNSESLF